MQSLCASSLSLSRAPAASVVPCRKVVPKREVTKRFVESQDTVAETAAARKRLMQDANQSSEAASAFVETFAIWPLMSKELQKLATKDQVSLLATKEELRQELTQLASNLATKHEFADLKAEVSKLASNLATKHEFADLKAEVSKLTEQKKMLDSWSMPVGAVLGMVATMVVMGLLKAK